MDLKHAYIIVVECEEKSRTEAKKILGESFCVDVAESAEKGFELINRKLPDLLLIEVDLPTINGFEMMKLLQKDSKLKQIPVIFLTTEYDRMLEVKGFKAGAQDFIRKPFAADVMLQRVKHVSELSRLQRNLQQEVETQTKYAEERRKQVERLTSQIINALAETIDAKDRYTNGHSLRVAEYSAKIAERAGKSKEEQNRLYYMGMLHDIGKIGIPDSIITKSSTLSDKEYSVTRTHAEIGAEILEKITEIPDLGIGARWHHEWYDGTGYPDGLKGNNIPEEARIIAVADAYDAMASKRSYRDVLLQQTIYEEIKNGKNTQFDPVFADIMLQLIEEDDAYTMREK